MQRTSFYQKQDGIT